MKQMTCVEMGGPTTCTAMISGNNPEEMVVNGMEHLKTAHPDMAKDVQNMPKEMLGGWRAGFQEKWDAAPEM